MWSSPRDKARYQLDYILVNQIYKNPVKVCKRYPGADIDSDHIPVILTSGLRLKYRGKLTEILNGIYLRSKNISKLSK